MSAILIENANLINEGKRYAADVLIDQGVIKKILAAGKGKTAVSQKDLKIIDATGKLLIPGVIDDQVHFREPGLTYKADIKTESRAAVAGGITSFMEMPNTIPNALTQSLLQDKYELAATQSMANYSFYMGASNDNLKEVAKTDPKTVCGIKVFMGSSTGNMLVDDQRTLQGIFAEAPTIVAVHCEHEPTIRENNKLYQQKYKATATASLHPLIRSAEACYKSSSQAVELAKKYGTRLHVLHLSTAMETALFSNKIPLAEKKITAEVCLHHLWFNENDYKQKGNLIKWNPAVKTENDRLKLWEALLDGRLDVVATDHAPHTMEEKSRPYFEAPSGGPMVQHLLLGMLEMSAKGLISLETMVEKMCHNPAILFQIHQRGFIREGYFADLVLIAENEPETVTKDNILYKCGWSPLEGTTFSHRITHTFINGELAYENGKFKEDTKGMRLQFNR
ncbi:MAG: dihydroorotase [Bacteroidales bacterium]|jgi:dihydroorotase|nr:dihydroorotase [Bacteroidales bacterium]